LKEAHDGFPSGNFSDEAVAASIKRLVERMQRLPRTVLRYKTETAGHLSCPAVEESVAA
jgi:hypothetical protein